MIHVQDDDTYYVNFDRAVRRILGITFWLRYNHPGHEGPLVELDSLIDQAMDRMLQFREEVKNAADNR